MNYEYTLRGNEMNWTLKAKIVERFGTQSDFAMAIKGHESDVSRVIRGRRTLNEEERQRWANLLGAESQELFRRETVNV